MSRFLEIRPMNPKLTPKQIAKKVGFSDFFIERYRPNKKDEEPLMHGTQGTSSKLKGSKRHSVQFPFSRTRTNAPYRMWKQKR